MVGFCGELPAAFSNRRRGEERARGHAGLILEYVETVTPRAHALFSNWVFDACVCCSTFVGDMPGCSTMSVVRIGDFCSAAFWGRSRWDSLGELAGNGATLHMPSNAVGWYC